MPAKAKPTIVPRKPAEKRALDPVAAQRFVASGSTDDMEVNANRPSDVESGFPSEAVDVIPSDPRALQDRLQSSKVEHSDSDRHNSQLQVVPDESHEGFDRLSLGAVALLDSQHRPRRVLTRARDGRRVRQLTAYLPEDLAKRLTMYCAEHEVDKSTVIAEAVARFFSE